VLKDYHQESFKKKVDQLIFVCDRDARDYFSIKLGATKDHTEMVNRVHEQFENYISRQPIYISFLRMTTMISSTDLISMLQKYWPFHCTCHFYCLPGSVWALILYGASTNERNRHPKGVGSDGEANCSVVSKSFL
jgi:hypothetical protein